MFEHHAARVSFSTDPDWPPRARFRRGLQLAAALLAIALVLIGLSILTSPQLPALGLGKGCARGQPDQVRSIISGEKAARNVPSTSNRNGQN